MDKSLFKRYATIKDKIAQLKEEEALVNEAIMVELKKNKLEKAEMEYGKFTVCKKVSWTYSEKVEALDEKLKLAKLKEQEKEIAVKKESNYLLFKPN